MKNPWEGGTFQLQEGLTSIKTKDCNEVQEWTALLMTVGKFPTVIYFLDGSPTFAFRIVSSTTYRELKNFLDLLKMEWSIE